MPEEALLKRVLPHSMEAEQSVIGSMIMDREAIVTASEIVQGEDFYNKQYGVLFDTMVELNDEGKPRVHQGSGYGGTHRRECKILRGYCG